MVSPDLRLVGILSTGAIKRYTATGIEIRKAVEVVDFYRKRIEENLS